MLKPLILDEWQYIELPPQKIVWGFFSLEDLNYSSIEECIGADISVRIFDTNDSLCVLKAYEVDVDFNNKFFCQDKPFILKTSISHWLMINELCCFYKASLHEFYHGQQYVKASQETIKYIKKLLTLME